MNPRPIERKICKQCDQVFVTTSRIQVVHPECRDEYYKTFRKKRYRKNRNVVIVDGERISKKTGKPVRKFTEGAGNAVEQARKRYFDLPCEVCGNKLTKAREFYHAETDELKEHHLCPNHLAAFRLGYLEALTWKQIDVLASAANAPASESTANTSA